MSNQPTDLSVLEKVVIQGDLSVLSPQERLMYYTKVCESVGLNPLTKPFEYLNLDGKLILYAKRDATDQLRKLHSISITITGRDRINDVFCVTARGQTPDGRTDESMGVVSLLKREVVWDPDKFNAKTQKKGMMVPTGNIVPLSPDELANALMRAETKAKRRVTLSLAGLGMMDESEIDTIERTIIEEEPPAPINWGDSSEKQKKGPSNDQKPPKQLNQVGAKSQSKPNQSTQPNGPVFQVVDAVAGQSPSGIAYLQIKVRNTKTGEEKNVFANTPETMELFDQIQTDSLFTMSSKEDKGITIVESIEILKAQQTNGTEVFELISHKVGQTPNGVRYAQMKVKNLQTGGEETILARNPEMIEISEKMQVGSSFTATHTIENGFKVIQTIQIDGVAA